VEKLRFDGRVVLVTGAGRGMGRSHAQLFAARGAKVVVSDVGTSMVGTGTDESVAAQAVAEIKAAGGDAVAYTEDLGTESGARGAVRCALDTYGRLDALVHNAGLAIGGLPFEKETRANLDILLRVNTYAAFAMIGEAWPTMQRQRYGRIVLIGSTGMYGIPGSLFYGTAKASYVGFARNFMEEAASTGVNINVVCPSGVSRMAESMPESEFRSWFLRTMKPEYVSAAVAFLSHEDCPVTGETFAVAGGRVARVLFAENQGYVKPGLTMEDVRDHMEEILEVKSLTPFGSYAESVKALMNALGFTPTEEIGAVASEQKP
jgi:NAD(P)-dependent dehydrogenase (short-subunit alcohol dehydrogenase family)